MSDYDSNDEMPFTVETRGCLYAELLQMETERTYALEYGSSAVDKM